MKLRSSIVAAVEAPLPEDVPAPIQSLQDSFDFLALPQEIRMCVYRFCLVNSAEISLDTGNNAYYVINYADDHPSTYRSQMSTAVSGIFPAPVTPSITVNVPANFSYPSVTNSIVAFEPPAPSGLASRTVESQIIPLAGVVQPASLSFLPVMSASVKKPFNYGTGIYIGPVHSGSCSYLPVCQYIPFASFNARLLQTCKTVYAEALPILYGKNQFVLHSPSMPAPPLGRLSGPPLAYLTDLRLEVSDPKTIIDEGGSNSLWSTIFRKCTQISKLTLRFRDHSIWAVLNYVEAIIRIAANIANVKKGTGEPAMTVKARLENLTPGEMAAFSGYFTDEVKSIMGRKKYDKMHVPRGIAVELMGKMTVIEYTLVKDYTRNGWSFRRMSPPNESEVVHGTWCELEWIKHRN